MKHLKYIPLLLFVIILLFSCATAEVRAVRDGNLQELEKFLTKGGNPNVMFEGDALIHTAVEYGQLVVLDRLLQVGANPDLLNSSGNSASILAARKNRDDMIKLLVRYKANTKITARDGKTTLMYAAANGNMEMIDRLLYDGLSFNAEDKAGMTAMFHGLASNNVEVLNYLLKIGSDPRHKDKKGQNALHYLKSDRQKPLALILIDAGADPGQEQRNSGETPLHIASSVGAWELVDLYLRRGAMSKINLVSQNGGAPLFLALKRNINANSSQKTLTILLKSGANPNLPSARGVFPLVFAFENLDLLRCKILMDGGAEINVRSDQDKTLLHIAIDRNQIEMVSLLLDKGIDYDLMDFQGNTPLFIAVNKRALDMISLLLEKGADPNLLNKREESPLSVSLKRDSQVRSGLSRETAILLRYKASIPRNREFLGQLIINTGKSGNREVAEILLDGGANPNESTNDGVTVLMNASKGDFFSLVEKLLESGARVNMRDKKGNTAMHFAASAGSVEAVKLLLRFGENPDSSNFKDKRPVQLVPQNDKGDRIVQILIDAGAQPLPIEVVIKPLDPPVIEPINDGNDTDSETDTEEDKDPVSNEPVVIVKDSEDKDDDDDDDWGFAKVLVLGEDEPRGVSNKRITFSDFLASVPQSYPRNMYSRSNQKEVFINIRNESKYYCELYMVGTDGKTIAIKGINPNESIELKTNQGNIFPIYNRYGEYFGVVKTTGQQKQYIRLLEDD